ncbi:MAG: hypothetical protein QXD34_01845 [Candidatus Bathyarchaeia archaeon]
MSGTLGFHGWFLLATVTLGMLFGFALKRSPELAAFTFLFWLLLFFLESVLQDFEACFERETIKGR